MAQRIESAGKDISNAQLLLRGLLVVAAATLLTIALIAKSQGVFGKKFQVTVLLDDVGDGLPAKSDVKFRGVLVGAVADVTPAVDGRPNVVRIKLNPRYATAIPTTVTARVVPSNAFAVSSIQLIDNGPGPALRSDGKIFEDKSLATVQFQTALTKLRDIVAAASRPTDNHTLGILAAIAEATDRRGGSIADAGAGANRIAHELNAVMAPGDTQSTLSTLSNALQGLQTAAPDLLDSVHHAVVPMRTLAEKQLGLTNFLSAGLTTFSTLGTAFENNTDRMIVITTQLSPVIGVLADGGKQFAAMGTRMKNVTDKFLGEVWKPDTHRAVGKFMVVFTPNRMYTRQDCPRYGRLEGPSCQTAPETADPPALPQGLDPRNYPVSPELTGGNVGPVGSPQEREQLSKILGPDTDPASELLIGPLARGTTVQVIPDPGSAPESPPPPADVGTQEPGEGQR